MTRINLIDPYLLSDQHLFAEYREITRIPSAVLESLKNGSLISQITSKVPDSFRLGEGHVCFFYDKLKYCHLRYIRLFGELQNRRFALNDEYYQSHLNDLEYLSRYTDLYKDYRPSNRDIDIIIERLVEKLEKKLSWYRYYGKSINKQEFPFYNRDCFVL